MFASLAGLTRQFASFCVCRNHYRYDGSCSRQNPDNIGKQPFCTITLSKQLHVVVVVVVVVRVFSGSRFFCFHLVSGIGLYEWNGGGLISYAVNLVSFGMIRLAANWLSMVRCVRYERNDDRWERIGPAFVVSVPCVKNFLIPLSLYCTCTNCRIA